MRIEDVMKAVTSASLVAISTLTLVAGVKLIFAHPTPYESALAIGSVVSSLIVIAGVIGTIRRVR